MNKNTLNKKKIAEGTQLKLVITAKELAKVSVEKEKIRLELVVTAKELAKAVIEREKLGKEIKESETKYRRLFETAKDSILILSADNGVITDSNPFLEQLIGYSKKDLVGKNLWQISPFKNIVANKEKFIELQEKKYVRYENLPLETKSGKIINVEFISNVYLVENKKVIQCNIRDITDRVILADKLLESRNELEYYFESIMHSNEAIIFKDLNGIILKWNYGAEKIYGYSAKEMVGKPIKKIVPKEKYFEINKILTNIKKGEGVTDLATVRINKNGERVNIMLVALPIRDKFSKIIGCSIIEQDITKRLKVEEKISNIALNTPGMIYLAKSDWTAEVFNDSEKISGYSKNEFNDRKVIWSDIIYGEDAKKVREQGTILAKKKDFIIQNYRIIAKSGEIKWVEDHKNSVFVDNKFYGIYGIVYDITEKKIVEGKLLENEKKLNILNFQLNRAQETAKIGSWAWDSIEDKITWSKELYHIYGLDDHLPVPNYEEHLKLYSLESRKILDTAVKFALKNGTSYKVELQLFDISKGIKWVIGCGEVLRNSKGQIIGQRGTVQDITERKELEYKLSQAEKKNFKEIFDHAADGIAVVNLETKKFKMGNPAFCKMLGYKEEDIYKMGISDIHPEDAIPFVFDQIKMQVEGKIILSSDLPVKKKDGTILFVDISSTTIRIDNTECLMGFFHDNSEHIELEKNREYISQAKEKIILASIGDGVIACDKDENIIIFNNIAAEITGFSANEAIGKNYHQIISLIVEGTEEPNMDFIAQALREGKPMAMDNHVLLVKKNEAKVPVTNSIAPFFDLNNNIIGCVVVFHDVSRERKIDKAKTEFVSLVSHQLRTPISSINWLSEMFISGDFGELTDKQKISMDLINRSSQRMSALIGALLNVSRIELGTFSINPEPVMFSKVIDDLLLELNVKIVSKKIKIVKDYLIEPLIINADLVLLRVILQNLLSNAVSYAFLETTVSIKIEKDDNNFIISVSNQGIGIPESQKSKIFSKLFRANNAQLFKTDGNGLGLYMVKEILDNSGGKIWFKSKENKETTFFVSLKNSGMKLKKGAKLFGVK